MAVTIIQSSGMWIRSTGKLWCANIIDTVCNHKSLDCGSIILCHLGAKYTSQALDEMLTKLQDMGYEIVPVSKLIMTEGYHMDANGMQIKD